MSQSQSYDFSDAQPNVFEVIPDGTEVPVIFMVQAGDPDLGDGCYKRSKDTGAVMLNLEATVTAGPFAKRKFFPSFYLGPEHDAPTEKQQTGIAMSKSKLRAILETARGFSPTDETPAAIAARGFKKTPRELDGMECSVIVGVEKGTGTFSDKNVIKRVVPHGKAGATQPYDANKEASMRVGGTVPQPAGNAKKW